MSNSTNASFDFCEDLPFFRPELSDNVPYLVTVILIFSTGCIGNVVTVVIISCWRKLHTPTFTMLACLAVSDAYSLISYTLILDTNMEGIIRCQCFKWRCNANSYYISITFQILNRLGRFTAGMQLCILALLRYIAIVYPLKFKTYCTCKLVILMSLLGAVVILIFAVVFVILVQKIVTNACVPLSLSDVLNFIIPSLIFIVLHILKLREIRLSPSLNISSLLKMNIVITIVLSIYVTSSASVMIINIRYCHMDGKIDMYWIFITKIFFLGNCAINPFIYFFSSPPIVQLFRNIWHILSFRCHSTDFWYTKMIVLNSTLIKMINEWYFHALSLYDVPVRFVTQTHPSLLRLCIALLAIAEGWLLLNIVWVVLFCYTKICVDV